MTQDEILSVIAKCGKAFQSVFIYYPSTDTHPGGLREIQPYSIRTNIGPIGEKVVYGTDAIDGDHYLCASNCDNPDRIQYFQINKIQEAMASGNPFAPKWEVEFH